MKKFISMLLVVLIFCIGAGIAEGKEVSIDIKPDTVNNTINLDSNGLLPVAILGAEDFNVTDINVSTLRFGTDIDETNSTVPIRFSYNYTDNDVDYLDLIMKFEIKVLADLPVFESFDTLPSDECVNLSVFGTTLEGDDFSGMDCVYNPENFVNTEI